MQSIVNSATIGPIVFFVGLLMNEEVRFEPLELPQVAF